MNKKLSRLISMVLAMVMTLSCFVCSSVEALAAQTTQVWTPDNTQSWVSFSSGFATDSTSDSRDIASFNDLIFDNGTTGAISGQKANKSSNSKDTITVTTTSDNAVLKMYAIRIGGTSNIKTFKASDGTEATINAGSSNAISTSRSNDSKVSAIEYTLSKAGTYTITFANSNISVYRLELTDEFTVDPTETFDCDVTVVNSTSNDVSIMDNGSSSTITAASGTNTYTFKTLDSTVDHILGFSTTDEADKYNLKDGNGSTSINIKGVTAITVYVTDKYFTAYVNVANSTDEALEVKLVGADGTETTAQTVTANSPSTEYSFTKLNAYDDSDAEIVYTVYVGNKEVGTVQYSNATLSNINITTTTATESTSETTTEATTKTEATEATTASASDCVVAGTYALNKTTLGTNVTGTYRNISYENLAQIDTSEVRIDNTGSIKFKVAVAMNLTINFSSNNISFNGTVIDRNTYSKGYTVNLTPGVEYTITGATSSKARIQSLVFKEGAVETTTQATTATATEATTKTEATTETTTVDLSKNVVVYNSDGTAVGSYDTIQAAVNAETTVENCVIQVKPGNYVEQVRVPATVKVNKKTISKKGITIKKADGTTGDVVIYYDTTKSGAYVGPAKMYPIVHIEADNVTLSDLTIINPYNVNVGDVTAKDTIEKRAALAVEGNNGAYNNLVLTSVQDTVFLNQNSTNTNTFNYCTIKGTTDWICGGGVNVFNKCNFVFYTGDGAQQKNIGYVFAVGTKGNYTVNGGTLSSELPNAASANYYYARAWMDSTPSTNADYPVLHIFALDNQLPTTFGTSGLLGFYGLTGGSTSNYTGYLLKCDFRAYAGTDTNSELIGTVDPSVLSGLISMNDVSEYKFESNENRLLVADYGNQYKTLTRNSIVDAKTYGFVLFENAADATEENAKKQVEAGNAIESTTLFNTIATESGKTYSLADNKTPGTADDGKYFGVGIVESDTDLTGEIVTVIPYIAFDGSYTVGGVDYDTDITYCFGAAKTITFE